MFDFIMAEDSELMDIILDGPHVPVKKFKERDITKMVIKIGGSSMMKIEGRFKKITSKEKGE